MKERDLITQIKQLEAALRSFRESELCESNDPEIIPAEPLREMPNQGEIYHFAHTLDKAAYCNVMPGAHEGKWEQVHYQFQAGLLFPYTPEGKAGAELRAKQGIVPYPAKSSPEKIESMISTLERMIFEIQAKTEFRSEFDFMNEKLQEVRNEISKAGHITPAKALTEPLGEGEDYWYARYGDIIRESWEETSVETTWLSEGRIFPYTVAGKLGAALYQEGQNNE